MDYFERLDAIGIKIRGTFNGAKNHHTLECLVCNHTWSATPISKLQAFKKTGRNGCPSCNNARKLAAVADKRMEFIRKIEERGITILSTDYIGDQTTTTKISVRFNGCGHQTEVAPGNLIHRSVGCAVCAKELNSSQNRDRNAAKHIAWAKTATDWEVYRNQVDRLTRQIYSDHKSSINPLGLVLALAGTDGYQLDHIVPARWGFDHDIPVELIAHIDNLQVINWKTNLSHKDNIKGALPKHITTAGFDHLESDIIRLFQELIPTAEPVYDTKAVNAFRLSDTFAVIVASSQHNSPVWLNTTDRFKVLIQKTDLETKFDRVVVVTADELHANSSLVVNKLKHLAGENVSQRIHARKCRVQLIDAATKNAFLNAHHIQGQDTSSINLGAFCDDKLLAVMTFCKPRILMGKRTAKRGEWELSRFTTHSSYRIPGVASKMLKWFECNNEWTEIYSYADCRWSVGNVYDAIGFELEIINKPAYWYVTDSTRKHRWGFRKDVLKHIPGFDPSLTEYQNVSILMPEYQRLYDCGTRLYRKRNNHLIC